MNRDFLISIIVPIFNSEKYLERCIDSICSQTYSNLEIILINDGSIDDSGDICDKYALNDKRIHVIHTVNGGQASARNIGLTKATGEYIGFVDSDDYIDKDMYKLMVTNAITEDADIVQIGHYVVDEDENILNIEKRSKTFYYDLNEKIKALTIEKEIVSSVCDKLFHKSLWNDIKMEEGYYYEDGMVLLKLLKSSRKTLIIDDVGYYYVLSRFSTQRGPYNVRHLESCLYEPNYYYNFFKRYAKEFEDYGIALKCYRSMRGYRFLTKVNGIDNKTRIEYKHKFIDKFNKNYVVLKSTSYYKQISIRESTAMFLFSKSPSLYLVLFHYAKELTVRLKNKTITKKKRN